MGCLYPKVGKNKKYTKTKKNKGVIPIITDPRIKYISIPCGQCMECKKKESRNWAIRLKEEIQTDGRCKFITLTFDDRSLVKLEEDVNSKISKMISDQIGNDINHGEKLYGYNLENEICKVAVKRLREAWRSQSNRMKIKDSLKYWFSTELGQTKTERIHMHGIVWTDDVKRLENTWKYGYVDVGEYCNEQTINYIVKYVSKVDPIHKNYKSIRLNSNGIGKGYLNKKDAENNKYKGKDTKTEYRDRKGYKSGLPTYYRRKLMNEEECEKAWVHTLDKEERYVNGQKYDVSNEKGMRRFEIALNQMREKGKRLGFNDDSKNYEKIRYENDVRNLMRMTRKQKVFKINNNNKKAS
jgi:hypothetical protein